MPLYVFHCDSCGHEFEDNIPLSQEKLPSCPQCNKEEVHKVPSTTAFILKGKGWSRDSYS